MPAPVPIALVDDHALFRAALHDLIGKLGGYHVAVQAGNGEEYKAAVADGTRVAVALVDLHMPTMDGYQTIAWIKEHQPGTRALALTFDRDETVFARALQAGACGFLTKNVDRRLFAEALEQVALLGHYINEDLVARGTVKSRAQHETERARMMARLSPRELELIRRVCEEDEPTYEQIADRMGLSLSTVQGHREAVFAKLKVKSKAGLVIFAYKWGVV